MEIPAKELAGGTIAAVLTTYAYAVSRRHSEIFAKTVACSHLLAASWKLSALGAMVLPLVLRLALLPWVPPPQPQAHDEFSHLLVAETLAAGRMANPPHPLWHQLETIYVVQQPTYSSVYPIGQGIFLAIGKVLTGTPWAGLLFSVVLMCGATTWMLLGCLPPKWAAIGGLLAASTYGLVPMWLNSYWGGSSCAFGGALLFGALCRLRRSPSRLMALLAGVGWSIVWLTRPFESLLPLVICWGLIAASLIHAPQSWRAWLPSIATILSIQILTGGVTALHNRAVTGSVTTVPYFLDQRDHGVPQSFLWQKPIEEPPLQFTEFKAMYRWQRHVKDQASKRPGHRWILGLGKAWSFYITPWYSLPFALLVFHWKDRLVVFGVVIILCALTWSALYPFFYAHYIAAYSCVFAFLITRGMMTLFPWSLPRGKVVGPFVILFLLLGGSSVMLQLVPVRTILGRSLIASTPRVQVADWLKHFGGRHVVFVRYGASHSFQDEWVYNSANVDASPIVWCRAIDSNNDLKVLHYYKDRHFWIADVDRHKVRIYPYEPQPPPGVSTGSQKEASQDSVLEIQLNRDNDNARNDG